MKKHFWEMLATVFVVVFVVNTIVAWAFDRWFSATSWRWDTSSVTAVVVAVAVAIAMNRKKGDPDDHGRKIVSFLRQHGEITNNDVERLLGVSDATATRYLDKLEEQNVIVQIGSEGRYVKYRLK